VFGHGGDDVESRIYMVRADGSDLHSVFDDPGYFDLFPSFTADGSGVVFMRCSVLGCPIYRVRLDGTGLGPVTPPAAGFINIAPMLAPDGTAMAFGSLDRDGVQAGIYATRPDGSGIRLITPPYLQAFTPDWSPDSGSIVFQSNRLGSIFAIRPDGSHLARLTQAANKFDQVPSWSPQHDAIAFERNNANFSTVSIWVMRPDGTHAHLIRRDAHAPRWGSAAANAAP
jgi:Tol biopolymer transport system component